jgi:lipopolysaccharide export system permease protein
MTRYDRYVMRQFIVTALFALVAITLIFIATNMMDNIDDFLDRHATVWMIAEYYLYFTPEIIKLMTPVAMLLSALFTTGRLSTYNELTALKSAGISLYRFMAPIIAASLLVTAFSIYFNGWIVPKANREKLRIARVYFQKDLEFTAKNNIYIQDSRTRILSIGMFDDQRNIGYTVSIDDFNPSDLTNLSDRYDAAEMQWDATSKTWSLVNGTARVFGPGREQLTTFEKLPIGTLSFSPDDIRKKQEKPEEMAYDDLRTFVQNQQRAGHDPSRWLVDLYGKIAFPFSSVIVILFGVPFSSIKRRSGLGVELGIGVGICFLYMIFLQISQAFGYNGEMNPLLTAWLANVIFLIAAVYVIWKVPK